VVEMAYSEYAMENINIEESKVLFEDKWYSLEELKTQIKTKVNSDDFNVAPIANAIQEFSVALANIQSVKLTLHIDLINKYKEEAQKSGTSFENLLRETLITRVDHGFTDNMNDRPNGASRASSEDSAPAYKPKKVACRKCRSVITVDSPVRPITIECPECGSKGKLSK
jgi:hypothetical protein